MADTAIVEHTELALASVVRDRALLYDSLVLVLAFGPCFACSCDQKVLTCLLVSSRRSFYIVPIINAMALAGKMVAVVGGGVGGLVSAGLLAAQRELG